MPETQTVYKVVRRGRRERRWSAIVYTPGVRVEYVPHQETHSPDSRYLFAFDSLRQAKRFLDFHGPDIEHLCGVKTPYTAELWEAEATGVRPATACTTLWEQLRHVKDFWQALHKGERQCYSRPPAGTVFCESITLKQRVE